LHLVAQQTHYLFKCLDYYAYNFFYIHLLYTQAKNTPFRRVREEAVQIDPRLLNNSFESKVNHNLTLYKRQTKATHESVTFKQEVGIAVPAAVIAKGTVLWPRESRMWRE
jgi:hypothetical protein